MSTIFFQGISFHAVEEQIEQRSIPSTCSRTRSIDIDIRIRICIRIDIDIDIRIRIRIRIRIDIRISGRCQLRYRSSNQRRIMDVIKMALKPECDIQKRCHHHHHLHHRHHRQWQRAWKWHRHHSLPRGGNTRNRICFVKQFRDE